MGLGSRIGIVFSNIAILIPVYILLIVSAIMSSIGAAKIASLDDQAAVATAHKYVTNSTILLWLLFAGGLVFSFTIGIFIIPWLVTIPYLYGGVMILFSILNLVISGLLFYSANAVRLSTDYKNGTDDAKSAYTMCLSTGLMMVITAIFLIAYSAFTIYKYHKGGGLRSDIVVGSEIGAIVAPEFAPILGVVGTAAKKGPPETQQQEQARQVSSAKSLINIGTKLAADK